MQKANIKIEQTLEIDSWQLRVLILWGQRQDYWLIDYTTNIPVYNNLKLMTEFIERPTTISGSILDGILSGQGIV